MSDKERFGLASAVRELATLTDGCERRAADLLRAVTELSVLLECPKKTPRKDGGRPLRHVSAVWEDAADWITNTQQAAAACVDDVLALIPEIEYCAECLDDAEGVAKCYTITEADEYREKYEAARRTLEQYAEEIQAAKEKQRAAENRASMLADIYGHLCGMTADRLSDEERQKHREFKAKLQRKRKRPL